MTHTAHRRRFRFACRRTRMAQLALPFTMFLGGVAVDSIGAAPSAAAASSVSAAGPTVTGIRQTKVIGRSVQGRDIVAHRLGNPAAPTKVLVLGSMHGVHERAGEQVVAGLLSMGIPTNLDLWVIPTVNPDGTAMGQRANAHHVDLNRDWDNQWIHIPSTPSDRFGNHGNGSAPWSQPETRALRAFLQWLRPARMVSIHQPLGGVDTTDGGAEPQGRAFRNALATNLGLPLRAFTCGGVCRGTMTGWLTRTSTTVAITVEFGASVPADQLRGPAAEGILAAVGVGIAPVTVLVKGTLEQTGVSPGSIRVRGWALDPLFSAHSTRITVQVDGKTVARPLTGQVRADVNRAQHAVGRHGFDLQVTAAAGRHRVCVSAAGYSSSPTTAGVLARGCVSVTVPPVVIVGRVDELDLGKARIQLGGWTIDPQHPATSGIVRVLLDGRRVADITTSVVRRDVNSRMRVTGRHGFQRLIAVTAGRHTLEVIALRHNSTSESRTLLRRVVTVNG